MSTKTSGWVVIGVSGATCGGKTTLCDRLVKTLSGSYAVHQDMYFHPDNDQRHVPVKGLKERHNNYDILSALDMPRMCEDVKHILRGEDRAHDRNLETKPGMYCLKGNKFLIIEGFTVLNYRPLLELCDLKYYLELSFEECQSRRTYRLYDPPDVDGYFQLCVWPEHMRYKQEIVKDRSIKLLDGSNPDVLGLVLDDLKSIGAEVCNS